MGLQLKIQAPETEPASPPLRSQVSVCRGSRAREGGVRAHMQPSHDVAVSWAAFCTWEPRP